MKNLSIKFILLILLFLLILQVQVWHVRANELFGAGKMYAMGKDIFAGFISGWGVYVIYGRMHDCRIVPLWSPVGDAGVTACSVRLNEKANKFSGWIDFRGHPRPFCGSRGGDLPVKCFGE